MSAGNWKDMISAVQSGELELVKYHIENNVDPNYEHPEFFTTPLIESILFERIEIAKYLLKQGANPKLVSGFNMTTPLALAKSSKNKEMIQLIKSYLPKKRLSVFVEKYLKFNL